MSESRPTPAVDHPPPEQEQPTNLLALLHRLFRGRYLVAVPIVLLCAAGAGALGYLSGGPVYTSTGVVRVRASLPKILYATELADTPAGVRFENFVSTQARLFTTDRVLHRAIENPGMPADAVAAGIGGLRKVLDIRTERDAPELIFVNATTPEPDAAPAIVSATVNAYMELYADESSLRKPETINTLEDLRRQKQADIRTKRSQVRTLAEEWGTEDLESLHTNRLSRLSTLQESVRAQESHLLELRSARDRRLRIEEDLADLDKRTIEDLVELFPQSQRMASLVAQRSQYESDLRELRASGIMQQNIRYRATKRSLEDVDRQIREHARTLVRDQSGSDSILADIRVTETRVERLRDTIASARDEAARISDARSQLEQRKGEIEDLNAELERINNRLSQIMVESRAEDFSEVAGRISVISEGNAPTEPSDDTRKKLAVLGFAGGGGASFVLFAGIGWIDRRVRYSDDIARTAALPPLLAVVPRWKPGAGEPLLPAAIANILHRVRSLLEVKRSGRSPRPLVVTSALSGEGKTSLVLSLGVSYAHAGHRVLLLDLDPIGRALTAQIGISQPNWLETAFSSDAPELAARPTRIPDLDLIGATEEDEPLAARLTADAVERCFDRLSAHYDIVLVDTSPLIGGVESTLACAAAAGVILVVGRGTSQRLVQQCNEQLEAIGANVLGLVFNGATRADFNHSPSSQTYSARGSRRAPARSAAQADARRWCPSLERASLAEAVASTLVQPGRLDAHKRPETPHR